MKNCRVAKLVSTKSIFICEICIKNKNAKMYEYQSYSYVRGHTPKYFKKICGDCIYRECYGTKNGKIKKKEGSLDDTPK